MKLSNTEYNFSWVSANSLRMAWRFAGADDLLYCLVGVCTIAPSKRHGGIVNASIRLTDSSG